MGRQAVARNGLWQEAAYRGFSICPRIPTMIREVAVQAFHRQAAWFLCSPRGAEVDLLPR